MAVSLAIQLRDALCSEGALSSSLTLCSLGRLSPSMLCSHLTFRVRYNATSPPIYDLSAFGANHTKLVVYQGSDDHLADPEDVQVRAMAVAHPPFLCGVATLS